jgi:hypothetical protein
MKEVKSWYLFVQESRWRIEVVEVVEGMEGEETGSLIKPVRGKSSVNSSL